MLSDVERPAIVESRGVSFSGPTRPAYLPALTGLRFWAALHVLFLHVVRTDTFTGRIVAAGQWSVSLFFVLSGFILTHTYLASGRLRRAREFFVARLARVYPVYLVGIGLVLLAKYLPPPVGRVRGPVTARALLESLLMVQAWDANPGCINCPDWSLSNEAFFYLLFPVMAALLTSRSARGLWLSVFAAILLAVASGLVGTDYIFHPLARLPEFLFGVAIGLLALRAGSIRSFVAAHSSVLAATSAGAILLVYAWLADHGPLATGRALLLPMYGTLILALAFPSRAVEAAFGNRLLHRLGEWSYALYIVQFSVILVYANLVLTGWAPQDPAASALIQMAVAVALAGAIYHIVEVPARTRIRAALFR